MKIVIHTVHTSNTITQGSDSPLSGLVSMMVAMNILSETNASATYTRQLAFLAVAGVCVWGGGGGRGDCKGSRPPSLHPNFLTLPHISPQASRGTTWAAGACCWT